MTSARGAVGAVWRCRCRAACWSPAARRRAQLRSGRKWRRRRRSATPVPTVPRVAGRPPVVARSSTTRRCRRWFATPSRTTYDLRIAVARVQEARALARVAKSFLYPDVGSARGLSVNQASRNSQPPLVTEEDDDRIFNNTTIDGVDVVGAGSLRPRPPQQRSRVRAVPGDRGRPARRARHARERRRVVVLPAAGARPAARGRRAHARRSTTRPSTTTGTGSPAACRTGSKSIRPCANRSLTAASVPGDRAADSRFSRTRSACSPAGRLARSPADGRSKSRRCRQPFRSAFRPTLLERRPDVRRGRATARRGQCRYRRRQGAVLSDDHPHRLVRRPERRSLGPAQRRFDHLVARRRSLPAALQRRPHQAATTKRRRRVSIRRWPSTSRRRSTRTAKSPTHWSRSRSWPRCAPNSRLGVEALRDASQLSRERYDIGLSSYLEILIADQQLFELELDLARTRGDQMRALAQLYRALGGGWQPEPPTAPPPTTPTRRSQDTWPEAPLRTLSWLLRRDTALPRSAARAVTPDRRRRASSIGLAA